MSAHERRSVNAALDAANRLGLGRGLDLADLFCGLNIEVPADRD
jgi:hypothetical protein